MHVRISGLWLHPIAVFLVSISVYFVTMPRSITLEDAGLFQMVCHLGGISHPPGYPLFTQLCQPFVQLFDADVRAGNLLSGLFAALAVSLFHHLCFLYKSRQFAWVAALAYGFSATFWSQALIIEVYTLAVLMFLICWWVTELYTRTGNLRYFYLLGVCYGLALCNHWPLMVLSTPALLILLGARITDIALALRKPSFWVFSVLGLAIGLLPYLTLITGEPPIGVYGGIDSFTEMRQYVGRSMYADGHEAANLADKIAFAKWLSVESLTQPGLWAVPIVVFGAWRTYSTMSARLNIALLAIYLGTTFVLLSLIHFDYEFFYRAIYKPYPVIAYLAVALWFAAGVEGISQWVHGLTGERRLERIVITVAVVLVLISNFSANNRRDARFVEHYGRVVLNSLPENAVLFVYGDFETALFGYLVLVKGIRRDIELREWESLVFSNRLTTPFASDSVKLKAATEFIESSDRQIYSVANRLRPTVNHGLVYRFNRDGSPAYNISEGTDQFTGYLISLYTNHLITDPHERYYAFQLLIRLSRLYFGYALESEQHRATVQKRISELQSTFPGRLVSLETVISKGMVNSENRSMLLELAAEAETDIPEIATNKSLAVFYEYYGRILMTDTADAQRAFDAFEKSMTMYPSAENTSICPQRSLAIATGRSSDHVRQFEEVACP